MKRLQNTIINGMHLSPNAFNIVDNGKHKVTVYTWKVQQYEKIYLVRNEMELPFTDVYELRAYSQKGILCGYAFDIFCKNPIKEPNFIIAANLHTSLIDMVNQQNYLRLIYKLKGCNVYVLPGLATMLTISQDTNMKELLDI